MQEEELTRIAALVSAPEGATGGMRTQPRRGLPTPAGDRLDAMARWWTAVVGDRLPQRVEQFWLPNTGVAGPVRSQVVLHRFTAPKDAADALDWGIATADDAVDDGTDLFLVSVPVPAHDVAWQVAGAQVLGLDAVEAMGWPMPGATDHEWIRRVAGIRDGLKRVHGTRKEPYRLLHLLDHPELMAGTGLLLQAAARRTPAIIDGPMATACALMASRLAPAARNWWIAADQGRVVMTGKMLEELRLTPVTELGLDEGDGVAARLVLQLLETAMVRKHERGESEDAVTSGGIPGGVTGGVSAIAAGAAELDGAVPIAAEGPTPSTESGSVPGPGAGPSGSGASDGTSERP